MKYRLGFPVTMEVQNIFHMKEGLGETSYAQNSSIQKSSMEALKHIIINAAVDCHVEETPGSMVMADFGCATGLNSLSLLGEIVEAICRRSQEAVAPEPEFVVYLNDLPSNDFNTMFANFPGFIEKMRSSGNGAEVFLAGVPGTFYGRLFGRESIHFIFSCYSLHWISQLPPGLFDAEGRSTNKGHVSISETSPPSVVTAYFNQFQKDFGLFLRSRSMELKPRGRTALLLLGRPQQDHQHKTSSIFWDIIADSFAILVSQGLVEEEKVDSYDVPFYAPSTKEIEDVVNREGSFEIERLEVCELNACTEDAQKDVKVFTMMMRTVQESMLKHHFGEEIIEPLFQTFSGLVSELRAKHEIKGVHLIVVLRKLA